MDAFCYTNRSLTRFIRKRALDIGEILRRAAKLVLLIAAMGAPERAVKSGRGVRDALGKSIVFASGWRQALKVEEDHDERRDDAEHIDRRPQFFHLPFPRYLLFGLFFHMVSIITRRRRSCHRAWYNKHDERKTFGASR